VIAVELGGARVLFTSRAEGDVRSEEGRARVEALIGRPLAIGRQVHGATVRRVGRQGPDEADGQATARPERAPGVLVADCLPIALAGDGGVAMLHGGWRGLAAGVVEEGAAALRELGVRGPLRAAIGPGARACCYEVGDDVRAVFGTTEGTLDLPAIAGERLRAAGAREVEDVGICTICDERFFSYRRQGDAAGRQAGAAWLA
jgi:copper oxidase (laccase) domain-containing protein